jgi:hypothetical protein
MISTFMNKTFAVSVSDLDHGRSQVYVPSTKIGSMDHSKSILQLELFDVGPVALPEEILLPSFKNEMV